MGLAVVFVVLVVLVLLDWGPSVIRWRWVARRQRRLRDWRSAAAQEPTKQLPAAQQPPASRSWPAAGSDGEREEAALAADLMAGALPAARYRRLMADIAARDASHNPLVVPPPRDDR